MVRLLLLLALASAACRLFTGRWPWDFLKPASTRSQALFRARTLLGVEAGASRAQIIEAHRNLLIMVHPDRGGSSGQVHEANAARDLLLEDLPYES